jgi:polysaccharide export outer membrane protein
MNGLQRLGRILQGAHFVLLALALSAAPLNAAIPNIPPAMVAQLKNMSPVQQAALARQYGIEIPGAGGVGGVNPQSSTVGQPGEEIDTFERVQRMQLEQEIRETIAEEDGEELEEELKRFGLELFDREISTFAPVDDLPAPDGYLMGPGDSVNVYMFGSEEADLALSVTRDGQLLLPRLGPVTVTGLTFSEVKRLIEGKVASQLVGTDVVVSMGKLRAIDIFLAGDVYAPGSYSVSGLSTVLQALYAGGGITEIGSLRDIQVKRRGKLVGRLDAYDVLLRGDTSNDMRLASGDTVFVPTVNRLVTIDGEVKRPAIYEILSSDTLGDLLKMAGGLTASSYRQLASIERRLEDQATVVRVQVDLTDPEDLKQSLVDGDSLYVAGIKDEISNQVLLRGTVARPGGYAWRPGLRVSDLLANIDEDLLAETDLSTGLVVRRTGKGLEIDVLGLNLGDAIKNSGGESDLILRPRDEVLVFALPYLNDSYQELLGAKEETNADLEAFDEGEPEAIADDKAERFEDRSVIVEEVVFRLQAQAKEPASTKVVEISGDVRLPGQYPLLADRGLAALISLAGGYENSAYLETAEVTRLAFTDEGGVRISTFKAPLGEGVEEGGFELQPLDRVRISQIPNWSYGDSVGVTGAVAFPGEFPIQPGEKLSSVLARAGGVLANGFPEGAVLIKAEAQKRERAQIERLIASIQRNALAQTQTREGEGGLTPANVQTDIQFLESVLESDVSGRVVIDLGAIIAGNDDADIQLEAGDSLFIPDFNNTISVIGEVRQPGAFKYDNELSIVSYIDFAAGTTVRADDKETYVVRANGSVERVKVRAPLLSFTPTSASQLRPGDTIVVPVNEEYQPVLTRYKEISTVVFQSIASLYPLFRL